jgi:O-antigen ligase
MSSRLTSIAAWVVICAVFALPPLGVLAHKALAPLALLTALAALPLLHAAGWRTPWSVRFLAVPAIVALAWGWLSALWAIDPGLALSRAAKLSAVTLVGTILFAAILDLPERRRRQVGAALAAGLVLAITIIAIDLASVGGVRRLFRDDESYLGMAGLNNGTTLVTLLLWPAVLWIWRFGASPGRTGWRWVAPLPIIALAYLLTRLESQSAGVAFYVGAAAFVTVAAAPLAMSRVMALVAAAGTLGAPWLVLTLLDPRKMMEWFAGLPTTSIHRLHIWDFTVDRIFERPFLGWGLDSSRVMPGRDTMVSDLHPDLPEGIYQHMQLLPLHPHNAPLQLWLELGLPGAALFALITGGLLFGMGRRIGNRLGAGIAAAVLVVALALSSFSYGIWQTWWLAALWFAAALTAVTVRRPGR